jgi:hypothetical protein
VTKKGIVYAIVAQSKRKSELFKKETVHQRDNKVDRENLAITVVFFSNDTTTEAGDTG